jgi:hypothetical protein
MDAMPSSDKIREDLLKSITERRRKAGLVEGVTGPRDIPIADEELIRQELLTERPDITKVVDAYHGTSYQFPMSELRPGEDLLIHTTPHESVAKIRTADVLPEGDVQPRILKGKLRVKNPVTIEDVGNFEPKNIAQQLYDKKVLSPEDFSEIAPHLREADKLAEKAMTTFDPDEGERLANAALNARKEALRRISSKLEAKGHDPVLRYLNVVEKPEGSRDLTSYAVIDPSRLSLESESIVSLEDMLQAAKSRAFEDPELIKTLEAEIAKKKASNK